MADASTSTSDHLGLVVLAGLLLLAVLGGVPVAMDELSDADECPAATVIFARGSGQDPGSAEVTAFFAAVTGRAPELDIDTVELGAEEGHGGFDYPAIGGRSTLLGARIGPAAGSAGDRYFASVAEGRAEAAVVVDELLMECPEQSLILGGYSQGAHVVGEALFDLSEDVLDRVAFVALFGDPTLLTNGRGALPPACTGDHKPWRRGNLRCYHDGGVLGPRDPYVPPAVEERVGSWCDKQDGVCTGNEAFLFDAAHGEYPRSEIPAAAVEAVTALVSRSGG